MHAVISFLDAINATRDDEKALLIGNGFSAQYFNYPNLLDKAEIDAGSPIKALFDQLGTPDFEAVIRALEDAVVVERVYGNAAHADDLRADAERVREALVTAINATHPAHREELAVQYESAAAFLENFKKVFSLNYDLLLYWVNLEKKLLYDGFALGQDAGEGYFKGPFQKRAYCDIFNLHGGLHLFEDRNGELFKALNDGEGVIATITHEIAIEGRLPLYVAEGTSEAKWRKINSVDYLRHCYLQLKETKATMFLFGLSVDPNDTHIYQAIFNSKAKHVYFGVFQPDAEKVTTLDAKLAYYKKLGNDKVSYSFFNSQTAQVWDGPPAV